MDHGGVIDTEDADATEPPIDCHFEGVSRAGLWATVRDAVVLQYN